MKRYRVKLTCELPVLVQRGNVTWQIAVGGNERGGQIIWATRLADRQAHIILSASQREVDRALRVGLPSREGTVRHELYLALAAEGKAVIEEERGDISVS